MTEIPKNDCELKWYNVCVIARLPAMPGTDFMQRFGGFIGTARGCARAEAASLDKLVLLQAGGAAANLVGALHANGLEAIVWTVNDRTEWEFMARAGVDGITTDHIAMGLELQAQLPEPIAQACKPHGRSMLTKPGVEPHALELAPVGPNPSRDGTVQVEFSLPDAGPARLELMDVAGRLVDTREVGSFGPGRHANALGRDLRPGMYLVRLQHERGRALAKVAVTR